MISNYELLEDFQRKILKDILNSEKKKTWKTTTINLEFHKGTKKEHDENFRKLLLENFQEITSGRFPKDTSVGFPQETPG